MKTEIERKKISTPFKTCPCCGFIWNTRNDFILSNYLVIIGYQANFDEIEEGFFLFNHIKGCGSTMAISVSNFSDLYFGPRYNEPKTGSEKCEGRCVNQPDVEVCSVPCKFVYIREIIQFFKKAI